MIRNGTTASSRVFISDALHIMTLFSFALAQPLFSVLAPNPEYFIAHNASRTDLIIFLFLLVAAIPGAVVFVEWLLRRVDEGLRRKFHLTWVFLLTSAIFNPILKLLPDFLNGLRVLTAVLLGLGAAWLYSRFESTRSLITLMSPAVLIFPAVFLLNSPGLDAELSSKPTRPARPVAAETPVVFVVLDELPVVSLMDESRGIDEKRFPNFAALAGEATWYRNATTVADNTTYALPAILTGRYPDPGKVPVVAHYPDNLITLLGSSYHLNVVETATELCPAQLCQPVPESFRGRGMFLLLDTSLIYFHIVLPDKLARRLPGVRNTWRGFGDAQSWIFQRWLEELASDRVRAWHRFLDNIGPSQKRQLHFIHTLLPHNPYRYLPGGEVYSENSALPKAPDRKWRTKEQIVEGYYRHLLQVGFVDRLLGELISRLKQNHLYDSSLIVVLADHGISFRKGDFPRDLSETNGPDIMSVPLFIKKPGQKTGNIDDREASLIDVLPTIAEILGLQVPWSMDGRSLLKKAPLERHEKQVLHSVGAQWLIFPADAGAKYSSLSQKIQWFGTGADEQGFFYPRLRTQRIQELYGRLQAVSQSNTDSKDTF